MKAEVSVRHEDVPARTWAAASIVACVLLVLLLLPAWLTVLSGVDFGCDFTLYADAARRWVAGGPFYDPYQLAGPYDTAHGAVLYPPVALWLSVPFTILPSALWWLIPMMTVGWSLAQLRPRPWSWPLLTMLVSARRRSSPRGPAIP
jgi:hypothetical protein